ncbi:MAG TPA: hypothetical protein VIX89_00925, partial [Bryobacteraceae bacterium]
MIILKATRDSEAGKMPDQQLLAAMGKFNEELVQAGIMLAGEGLHPSSGGARVRSVRAMLGQQVTVKGATTLAGRLVARFGPPKAEILADADLASIGLPKARAESMRGFARAVCDGRIRFDGAASSQETIGRMCELPGVGPWTANYIAMRALGDPDAFPASDLGLLKAAGVSSARRLEKLAEEWRPWRSYAAMYLWESLRLKG